MKKSPFSIALDQFFYISALQRKIRQKIKNRKRKVPSFLLLIQFKTVPFQIEKKLYAVERNHIIIEKRGSKHQYL